MRGSVCLSVCLSCSDFGDYWQVTVDLGINLYSEQRFRTFHCAAFYLFFLFLFFFRLIVEKM